MTPENRGGGDSRSYVLKQCLDQDVKFIRLWFTDVLGTLKSIAITTQGLEDALTGGVSFDGSSIMGFARSDESDLVVHPDPSTIALLPWRPSENRVARVFSDIRTPTGDPYAPDPRAVLRRQMARAAKAGFTFYAGAELEFFLLESGRVDRKRPRPQPVDGAGYFDQDPSDGASDVRRDIILTLEQMGIAVDSSHHEVAPGQQEIDLQYADALTTADAIQTARFVAKKIARAKGKYATFMPRPLDGHNGSGLHLSLSLARDGRNAFFDAKDPLKLSKTGRAFVAGVLEHAEASALVHSQWVNSYRRLVPGTEAPLYATWAQTNMGDLLRVPAWRPEHDDGVRVEMRGPDAACNPYLSLAVLLAAGLDGIERGMEPPSPQTVSAATMTDAARAEAGIVSLPRDLGEALRAATATDFLAGVLGGDGFAALMQNKRLEWEAWRAHVSEWELRRYLPVL